MDELITVAQAARLRGRSVGAIHAWIRNGWLHGKKLGRDILLSRSEVARVRVPNRGWRKGRKRKAA